MKVALSTIDRIENKPHDQPMKFGDLLQGTIDAVDAKGRGLFTYDLPHDPGKTRTVVVPFTAIGDKVEVTFIRREQGVWIGRLKQVLSPSSNRIAAPCPHAGVCGGCLWQHMAYDAQIGLKKEMINRAFTKAGHEEQVADVVPSVSPLHYRNRMDYAIGWKSEVGLKESGNWNRYIDLSTCLLLDEETPTLLQTTRELMKELSWEPWDIKKHTGFFRYLVVRLGRNTQERLVMLVVKDLSLIDEAARAKIIERFSGLATTLAIGENTKVTDLSYVDRYEVLQGKSTFEEEVNGIRYQIHPNSFFQTNTNMAAKLQDAVLSLLGPLEGKSVLDLYCGLGFFGIACAKRGATVYGHELDALAIDLARVNAEKNGVADKMSFGAGAVEDVSPELLSGFRSDVMIVDPPRAGLHPRALALILEQKPSTIVYVSCNYHHLVEELKLFKEHYQIESLQALDLFPQTPHVEVVAKLVRKNP